MKERITLKSLWELLKDAADGFSTHKVPKLSAALAYYTIFSMGPLLVVVITICSVFFAKEAIQGQIYAQLNDFLGNSAAMQLQDIIENAVVTGKSTFETILDVAILMVGATGVFAEIQDSINEIWGIKTKPKREWLKFLQNRALSFSIVISLGFLLIVSLFISAVLDGLSGRLQAAYPDVAVAFFYIVNLVLTFIVVNALFMVVFKVLPDAKIRWRDVFAGSVVTTLLFMFGKFAISLYISSSSISSTYGAAGSIVVVLLWAFYTSIILYFGAELTRAYAKRYGAVIRPNSYSVSVQEVEIENGRNQI